MTWLDLDFGTTRVNAFDDLRLPHGVASARVEKQWLNFESGAALAVFTLHPERDRGLFVVYYSPPAGELQDLSELFPGWALTWDSHDNVPGVEGQHVWRLEHLVRAVELWLGGPDSIQSAFAGVDGIKGRDHERSQRAAEGRHQLGDGGSGTGW